MLSSCSEEQLTVFARQVGASQGIIDNAKALLTSLSSSSELGVGSIQTVQVHKT